MQLVPDNIFRVGFYSGLIRAIQPPHFRGHIFFDMLEDSVTVSRLFIRSTGSLKK